MPVNHKVMLLTLALSLFLGSRNIAHAQTGENSAFDLASCAWQASTGARVTIKGNEFDLEVSSLPRPEPRTVKCWAPLPRHEAIVIQGLHHGAVTENGWTFSFERSTGEHRQIYRGSLERQFTFPVPEEWSHDQRIGIVIGIPGDNPGYLYVRDLRLQSAPDVLLSSPEPLSPAEGQEVTSPAGDFLWTCPQPGSVVGYELAWQREAEKPQRTRIAAYFTSDAQGFWPSPWLLPGKYAWRVRAQNLAGSFAPWSRTMHFTVGSEKTAQPPDVSPSPQRPVTILDLPIDDVKAAWTLIPPDVRPTFLFRMGGPRPFIAGTLATAQAGGAPVALQVNGPHDIIAGRWDRVPLAVLEPWARQYSSLKAFYICEQQVQGGVENPQVADYLERLIALGQETGRPVFWADANWGGNIWLEVEAHRDFRKFLKAHYGYVYPLWKMNGGFAPYLAPAGLLGLWLSHTVAAWGTQPESFYWTEAGFTTLGTQLGYKEGVRQDAPLVIFQELALLGASAGAEIFSFEPSIDVWGKSSPHRDLETLLWPLFRLLRDTVIPSLPQVQAAVVRSHELDTADLVFRSDYTSSLRQLFAQTLGIDYPFQMIPASGNCYWIPFLPADETLTESSPGAGTASRSCPPPERGEAAIFKVGRTAFIFNDRVNWPEEESFSMGLAGTLASGKLGPNGWITVLNEDPAQAHVWFFGRKGSHLVMDFDRPVSWRAVVDEPTGPAGETSQAPSAKAEGWSGPIRHLDISAGQQLWNIVVRGSETKPAG